MIHIDAATVDRVLSFPALVETLRAAFRQGAVQPVRHHHTIERPHGAASTLLLMPAWSDFAQFSGDARGYAGVKIVSVSPDNAAEGKPAVTGVYLLMDGRSLEPLALIDGQRLTVWRTAAASALASTYLSRADASKLLIIGAGALAPFLARAHNAVRPIEHIRIWNRSPAGAERTAAALTASGHHATVTDDLDGALGWADIVSAATISSAPLVRGALLSDGTHVDLVGAFSPTMRESDGETLRRARVHVDTKAGALKEGGDVVLAIAEGAIAAGDVLGDLYDLTRGTVAGRLAAGEITLFKSVGAAIEDLAAAISVYESVAGHGAGTAGNAA